MGLVGYIPTRLHELYCLRPAQYVPLSGATTIHNSPVMTSNLYLCRQLINCSCNSIPTKSRGKGCNAAGAFSGLVRRSQMPRSSLVVIYRVARTRRDCAVRRASATARTRARGHLCAPRAICALILEAMLIRSTGARKVQACERERARLGQTLLLWNELWKSVNFLRVRVRPLSPRFCVRRAIF